MDLGAYVQIDTLESIMHENNISVPRLRGLRLMKNEQPCSWEDIRESGFNLGLFGCEQLCENGFRLNACACILSSGTDKLKRKYLVYDNDHMPVDIRWENIHGKKRKLFKYVMKQALRRKQHQLEIYNKYCGRPDILYIHARIGGGNWPYYHSEVDHQPWFIEKIDDAFDSTYCDIYARIQEPHKEIRE